VTLAARLICLVIVLAPVASLAACGAGHRATISSGTTEVLRATNKSHRVGDLYIELRGPTGAVDRARHSLGAPVSDVGATTHGNKACTFHVQSVTVSLYGGKSARSFCKGFQKVLRRAGLRGLNG
jgi:hypothetical protein